MSAHVEAPVSHLEKLYRGLTSPIRLLPDFLIIGTQRGGTTSLYNYLMGRPGVGPAAVKELHFFDKKFHKGSTWYRAHFPTGIQKYAFELTRKHHFVTGEASAYYLFHPHAPRRIAQLLPDAKLIVLLRNPIDRAYSQYNFEVDLGRESLSFEDAVAAEEERIGKERERILADERYVSFDHSRYSYLARGVYVDQLRTGWASFLESSFCSSGARIFMLIRRLHSNRFRSFCSWRRWRRMSERNTTGSITTTTPPTPRWTRLPGST